MYSDTHILPYHYYGLCSSVWRVSPYISNILLAQKRVILDINGKAIMDSVNRTIHIYDWVKYRKATLVFKSLNNLAPKYMSEKFTYALNYDNTRQYYNTLLEVPSGKKSIFENSFRYSGVKIWNNWNINIRIFVVVVYTVSKLTM